MAGELDYERVLRMPSRKFMAWLAYMELEPFGAERDNYHAAVVAKAVYDMHGAKKADGSAVAYEDFLLTFGAQENKSRKETRKQTPDEQLAIAKVIAMAFNAKGKNL